MIKVGSDFSGVGAFDQALRRLNIKHKTIFACDWDKYARQTYIENYGEPQYFPKDVFNRDIPKESLDIYMTSPPCQAFSLAGNRKGEDDKRGVLFYNSHEFIKINKPRYFIFENVKGLLSDDKGRTFQRWLDYLGKSINGNPILFPHPESVNYHIYFKVLNSKDFGVPQNRERVFIIGIRDDEDNYFRFPKAEHLKLKLKDILQDDVDDKYYLSDKMIKFIRNTNFRESKPVSIEGIAPCQKVGGDVTCFEIKTHSLYPKSSKTGKGGTGHLTKEDGTSYCIDTGNSQAVELKVKQLNPSLESGGKQPYQQNRIYDINGINPALNSGQEIWGGNILNTNKIRRLTPRECFRLQDFPETFAWSCSDSQAYKQAGNSITVGVLAKIIEKLKL
jgi:DNA (cytosine-5)-methyltransferase 1